MAAVCSTLKPLIDESRAEVSWGTLPVVTANAVQLLQLFQNLFGNSIKYSRPGIAPRIHVTAEAIGSGHRFAIQDNGIGIDSRHYGRVFSRSHAYMDEKFQAPALVWLYAKRSSSATAVKSGYRRNREKVLPSISPFQPAVDAGQNETIFRVEASLSKSPNIRQIHRRWPAFPAASSGQTTFTAKSC
jgi:hypothetical protein